jgi:hypothetical protein
MRFVLFLFSLRGGSMRARPGNDGSWISGVGLGCLAVALFGCNGALMEEGPEEMPPPMLAPGDTLAVSGSVVDFQTGDPVYDASVTTLGLNPVSDGSIIGTDYLLYSPPYSAFHILAGAEPLYMLTVGAPVQVDGDALEDVPAETIRHAYISLLAGSFGITPAPGTAIVFAQAVNEYGIARADVSADLLELADAPTARGPYFLDDMLGPAPGQTRTGERGYFVLFDVPEGAATFATPVGSDYTITGTSPTYRDAVTIMKVEVADGGATPPPPGEPPPGEPPPPGGVVSFSTDILPIFSRNGCTVCHSSGGEGYDQGGLNLVGAPADIHGELTVEVSPNFAEPRVNLATPTESLVLTMPSFEDPPDEHPNAIFLDTYHPDYQLLRTWIEQGAAYE